MGATSKTKCRQDLAQLPDCTEAAQFLRGKHEYYGKQ